MPISDGEVGIGKNILNGNIESFPHIAREYKEMDYEMDYSWRSKLWRG